MKSACVTFVLFLLFAMPAAAQRSGPDGTIWADIYDDSERVSTAENTLRKSTWGSGYLGLKVLEDGGLDCGTTRKNTMDFLDAVNDGEASVSFATPLTGLHGEYFTDNSVIVSAQGSAEDDRITITHEAQHWAGFGEPVETQAELDSLEYVLQIAAAHCVTFVKEEEEDEPCGAAADGMAADCGNPVTPTTTTCTEKLSWVPPLTIEVWVKPESSTLEGGEPVPTKHEAVPIPGITVSAESKGQWVEVVIAEGYWETITECTES